jgi:arabinogalactan endo-1,4-beta-galactosidase
MFLPPEQVSQGTPPYAVQIGNEISNGFLWNNASAGEPCATGGRLFCKPDSMAANWQRLSTLVAAGAEEP